MKIIDNSRLDFTADENICRVVNGMWQVSGAHGAIDPARAVAEMFDYVDAGFTSWDLADHYGPAEDLVGEFRRQWLATRDGDTLAKMQFFTKWVPRPGLMARRVVEQNIDRSRRRMNMETLDLLQFHWWEYADDNYLAALDILNDLVTEGQIRHLALTNFDTEHLAKITERGIRIVSNQVQYSLIDQRPEVSMSEYCRQHNIKLLTYGTLCGGLISARYLDAPEPTNAELNTASLRKYKQMIDSWGGWTLFQRLLAVLNRIAEKHQATIGNIAVRYILDRPAVGGVIIGARLGIAEHIAENRRVFTIHLDESDQVAIRSVLDTARNLYKIIGDCGAEYRRH